jgi:hypothetical protein
LQISRSTVEAAKALGDILRPSFPDVRLHYVQSYIALVINGKQLVKLRKRENGKPQVKVWLTNEQIRFAASAIAESNDIEPAANGNNLWFYADAKMLKSHAEIMVKLTQLVKASWEG